MLNSEMTNSVAQGGSAAIAIAFLHQSVTRMIPYSLPALVLIALDLVYGIRAAKMRGERIRFSTAVKKTTTKTFSYICWVILASTMSLAFHKDWIEIAVLGLAFVNEFASIVGNYLETKGLHLSLVNLYRWIFKKGAEKAGVEVTDDEANEIITEQPRDAKGRFVKRCGIILEQENLLEESAE